jgi:glutaminyl-tRNA synthetase
METKNILSHFIDKQIKNDINNGLSFKDLRLRFAPEPNGYIHIGHLKAICLIFGLQKKYNALVNLRFDDTNPCEEKEIYINLIKNDIRWLGFKWDKECYASDYFNQLYEWAIQMIKQDKAYVDEQNQNIIIFKRKNPSEPGIESPYRYRPILESIELFHKMKNGLIDEGSCVLRAKIDMKSSNMNLRDPIMYRIIKKKHHRTGNKWFIYPTYDWAHGQSDYIEKISHSICSFEFTNHKPLYNWFINQIIKKKEKYPKQYEFSRLNLSYNVMSKRKLKKLVYKKYVNGWDDPRMPTISGLRRRGYTPESLINFCHRIGISKRENVINIELLEFSIRNHLNKISTRVMVVINPIKLIITNYPNDKIEWIKIINHPYPYNRIVPFSKELYIEKQDVMYKPSFYRLSIGSEVRLKNAYIIKCTNVIQNVNLIEVHATYDPNSLYLKNLRKIKSTLHWVSLLKFILLEIRLYDKQFVVPNPDKYKNFIYFLNPNSLKIVKGYGEPFIKNLKSGDKFKFQRLGYFCVDQESTTKKIIFNMTVKL